MDEYFSHAYDGQAFVQFGPAHLGTLALLALVTAQLSRTPFSERQRYQIRMLIAALLLGSVDICGIITA
jgi:hypothetical protein